MPHQTMNPASPLSRQIEVRLTSYAYAASGGINRFRATRLGQGAYARTYLCEERASMGDGPVASGRSVALKVYREDAPDDYQFVLRREVEMLSALAGHEGTVGLLDVIESFPPTFVCSECGEAFHVIRCPECGRPLENDPEHRFALRCASDKPHVFHKTDPGDVRRVARRRETCQHDSECAVVSFLFRPALLLEALDVHLGELSDLLSRPDYDVRGLRVAIEADPEAEEDAFQRETFLLRLGTLVQTAEALAYVHEQGLLHADLAPENIMASIPSRPGPLAARLIDFGRARPQAKDRKTEKPQGRPLFCAPEMFMINSTVRGSIRLPRGEEGLRAGGECTLKIPRQAGEFIAAGDHVWDDWDGEYTVVSKLTDSAEEGSPASDDERYLLQIARAPAINSVRDLERMAIWRNASVGVATDIYAFGAVIAWFITAGRDDYVETLRNAAGAPRVERATIDESILPRYLAEMHDPVMAAIPLPKGALEDDVRKQLLVIVFKCLMRRSEGYAVGRASNDRGAAAKVAKDLRAVYNRLFFQHHTRRDVELLVRDKATSIATLEGRVKDLAGQQKTLEKELREARESGDRSRGQVRFAVIAAATVILVSLLFFAGQWAGILRLPQPNTAEASCPEPVSTPWATTGATQAPPPPIASAPPPREPETPEVKPPSTASDGSPEKPASSTARPRPPRPASAPMAPPTATQPKVKVDDPFAN